MTTPRPGSRAEQRRRTEARILDAAPVPEVSGTPAEAAEQILATLADRWYLDRGAGGARGAPGPRSGSGREDRNHGNAPSLLS